MDDRQQTQKIADSAKRESKNDSPTRKSPKPEDMDIPVEDRDLLWTRIG